MTSQYCFPPQSEVISACAELARRIVAGESLAPESSKKARVDGWFTVKEKSKDKGPSKAGKTLVIVGYVAHSYRLVAYQLSRV